MGRKYYFAGLFCCRSSHQVSEGKMSIFGNKKKTELPPLITDAELAAMNGATYEQVIDFLVAVNDKDYQKIIKVAETTRAHHVEIAKITGMKYAPVPSIFEQQTTPAILLDKQPDTEAGDFLDDDELEKAFKEPGAPTKPGSKTKPAATPAKGRKIAIKDDIKAN
jgi:hypothetical protein